MIGWATDIDLGGGDGVLKDLEIWVTGYHIDLAFLHIDFSLGVSPTWEWDPYEVCTGQENTCRLISSMFAPKRDFTSRNAPIPNGRSRRPTHLLVAISPDPDPSLLIRVHSATAASPASLILHLPDLETPPLKVRLLTAFHRMMIPPRIAHRTHSHLQPISTRNLHFLSLPLGSGLRVIGTIGSLSSVLLEASREPRPCQLPSSVLLEGRIGAFFVASDILLPSFAAAVNPLQTASNLHQSTMEQRSAVRLFQHLS